MVEVVDSSPKKYLNQLFHYLIGHVSSQALGFITFPVLTRILLLTDYGILSLVTNTIWFVMSVANLGLQQSSIRYYEEFRANKKYSLPTYYSTFFLSSLLLGVCGSLILLSIAQTILKKIVDTQTVGILSFISISVLLGCLSATLTTFLRAEQKTRLYNLLSVVSKIGAIGLSFIFLFFLIKGLYGFFFGSMLSQFLFVVLLIKIIFKNKIIGWKYFSKPFLKQAITYGLPLTIMEVSHCLLNFGDRYVIQYYLNTKALGLYSGAYTLSMQIVQLIDYPILYSVPVIYFELWENKGSKAVQDYLRDSLKYFALITFPIMFGVIAIAKELIVITASHKFVSSAEIIPFVVIGGLIFASSTFFSAGLYIHKKSTVPAVIMMISAAINISLNLFLVPKYGIMGAAIATLIGYVSYVIIIIPISFRYLSYTPDLKSLVRYMLYSAIMLMIIREIDVNSDIWNLLIKICAGISIYSLMVLTFEPKIRKIVCSFFLKQTKYHKKIV